MTVYLILDEQTGLLIFLFLLILLAWKPETLPKIARELGRWYNWARREMEEFMREINEPIHEARATMNNAVNDVRRTMNEALDPDILRIAKALNINTQGKTRQQVIDEILRKLSNGENQRS
ncbi:Sec-independent protein translocase subunit TatA/TatB [Vulcanisaeta distributa]|uniref:Twin arginine-targeting protein translocase n=1 Tax=Vulcanisaeta distributa (strain DSM 14429 / JCM 11212 / NBRC 100878 / IC-017) TaxID=572478 RepID=E1QPY6_VULDI|nr:hypothetical protein [Vulcanisaeta distributa]ADN51546.1 twin arginine-targeting protein translocase [Vulcanisaeta distributa DSM 14429]